jgi:uncharacterized membrane protein HdeD (DUF308 family)
MTAADIRDEITRHRGWFIFLGVLLIIAGASAIAFPFLGTLAVEVWAAIAFAIAGVAQTVHAFAARSWGGFFLGLLVGLLYLATGIVLWVNPIGGIVALTVFLAAVLVVDGLFRSVLAFQIRPREGWIWLLVGGVISIILGLMIWQQLPSSAAWILGLLLGINLVFSGVTFVMLGSTKAVGAETGTQERGSRDDATELPLNGVEVTDADRIAASVRGCARASCGF